MLKISALVLLIPLVNIQTIQELQFEFGVLFHSLKLGDHVQILPLIILPHFSPKLHTESSDLTCSANQMTGF